MDKKTLEHFSTLNIPKALYSWKNIFIILYNIGQKFKAWKLKKKSSYFDLVSDFHQMSAYIKTSLRRFHITPLPDRYRR